MTWLYDLTCRWNLSPIEARRLQETFNENYSNREKVRRLDHPPRHLIGVDEVGYGPLAGPLVVVAAVTPIDWTWKGLRDSKKLSPTMRSEIRASLRDLPYTLVDVPPAVIDAEGNPQNTLRRAHRKAIDWALDHYPGALVVIDGNFIAAGVEGAFCLTEGDDRVPAVMAASVIAKVAHDEYMVSVHDQFPLYGFAQNKGYGTPAHIAALRAHGPCVHHRMSYAQVTAPAETPHAQAPKPAALPRSWKDS